MINIYKLGKSVEEIEKIEKYEGKLKKKVKENYLFLNEHQKLSINEVHRFEKEINKKLPNDYVDFLLKNNGGSPEYKIFSNGRVINFFFCVLSLIEDYFSIKWYLDMYEDRYPDVMFPIASVGGGDLLLMGLSGDYESKIYYWDHNLESENEGNEYFDNITFVEDSLYDFLNNLYKEDDE